MNTLFRFPEQAEEIERHISMIRDNFGKTIIFTNGCFDLLHAGHVSLLSKAKNLTQNAYLIVGLNSDSSVRKLKGNTRPIYPESERAFMLSNLKPVDLVIIFEQTTPLELIKLISPDVLVKGKDYKVENVVGREYAEVVLILDSDFDVSTTKTINKICSNYQVN